VACALGAEACHHYYKTLYIRLPELFLLLGEAADAMVLRKWLNKFTTPKLLIIDDWLLDDTMGTKEVQWLMEIAQQREDLSTIFCSQVAPSDWYDILNKAGGRVADAIMDRIVNNTYQIAINSMDSEKNISMRALYNPLKTSKA
jgi:DNA replication protein DnaC